MDTSAASTWVTDSAAGMTAIVTGEKTHNGVISQGADAQRGIKDGQALKTILEYAEEHGLATGVVTNSPVSDATPAACYAHSNDRGKHGEIFAQVLKPRFGNGVDILIGPGRETILRETAALGIADLASQLKAAGYEYVEQPQALDSLPASTRRIACLLDSEDFELIRAVDVAITTLRKNPKGFFLMVESNNHFGAAQKTLDRLVKMDVMIEQVSKRLRGSNTLILFAADHSFGVRISQGNRGDNVVPMVVIENTHTAEEVVVTAEGPGAERIHGFFPNTQMFHIMMSSLGWKP
jgi:alkaline phosphatase